MDTPCLKNDVTETRTLYSMIKFRGVVVVFVFLPAVEPAITKEPTQQKVAKERNVTIPCQVTGKPKPSVVWYKGSQLLSGNRYKIMDNGDLHVAVSRPKGLK